MKKLNTRKLNNWKLKNGNPSLQMLTCYDFQTAQMFNETELDLILVGDSVGNVILGYDTTVQVSIDEMITFAGAVKRGAPDKFVVADLPFGTYSTFDTAIANATKLFQKTNVESIKLEGAQLHHLQITKRLTESGIPVMGHIGLTPQSVHQLGGYYTHGKDDKSAAILLDAARKLELAGAFAVVLECVEKTLADKITREINIPTIGIGSGNTTDGQVLVINDLLNLGPDLPPKFCKPVANFFQLKKELVQKYLTNTKKAVADETESHYH